MERVDISLEALKNPKGVGVAVISGCDVLMGKRKDSGEWCLAGGGIEEGETPAEAACRELFEEFGIKADPSELTYLSVTESPVNKFKPSDKGAGCNINYILMMNDFPSQIQVEPKEDEMTEYEWFFIENVLSEVDCIYPATRYSIQSLLQIIHLGDNY